MPQQAVALSSWLRTEGLVSGGQLTAKAAGVKLESLVPPSMRAMVQAQVDQLAPVPRMVLRCASVLPGAEFSTDMMHQILPRGLVQSNDALQEHLHALEVAGVIQQLPRSALAGQAGADNDDWRVRGPNFDTAVCHVARSAAALISRLAQLKR